MIERIARVLAAYDLSANAEGFEFHAGNSVDLEWEDRVNQAIAVLRTMREPDREMAQAGSVETWQAMITTALAEAEQPSLTPGR